MTQAVARGPRAADSERYDAVLLRSIYGLGLAYPALWMVGVAGAFWVALAVPSTMYLLRSRLTGTGVLALTIPLALILSMPVGFLVFGVSPERVVGALANIAVWIVVAAGMVLGERRDIRLHLARVLVWVGACQGALTLLSSFITPAKLPVPLLSPVASALPGSAAALAQNRLYYMDWLGGAAYRSAGLMGQPTWAGAFAAVAIVAAIYLLIRATNRTSWWWGALWSIPLCAYSLALSLSRSTTLVLLAALILGAMMLLATRHRAFGALIPVFVIALIPVAISLGSRIGESFDELNSQREGSAEARGDIYAQTWKLIGELPIAALGYGIKPREDGLVASVATHSAYLGLLFRAGALGVALWLALILRLLYVAVRARDALAFTLVAFVAAWCILEDFDPGHLLPLALIMVPSPPKLTTDAIRSERDTV